jgi:S-(hydroxymethyl)glutathione dehydrogenase / alcohol dehydrogenase
MQSSTVKVIGGTYYRSVRPNIDFPILADPDLEKKINLDDLIGRTYRFDQINEGLALMLVGEVARGIIAFD